MQLVSAFSSELRSNTAIMSSFSLLSVITLFFLVSQTHGALYKTYSSQKCNDVIYLECPTISSGSAGRLEFRPPINITKAYDKSTGSYEKCGQTEPCTLTVKTRKECGNVDDQFSIYFSFRTYELPEYSQLYIYDASEAKTLLRSWRGGNRERYYSHLNVGQVRSEYAKQPALSVEYQHGVGRDTSQCRTSRKIVVDFTITESRTSRNNTYCGALEGHVNNDYICDTTEGRVNCPERYGKDLSDLDQVYRRQYCLPSPWIIGGLVAASLAGLVVLIGFLMLCRRRCRTCVCRAPRKICNWSSQRQCSFSSPFCSCSLSYDVACDTGSEQKQSVAKKRLIED